VRVKGHHHGLQTEVAGPQQASVSIGTNPTFSGRERRVEAYVLDFAGDLYGERVSLDFVARLREQRTYDGIEPLVAQIREDVEQTRALLG
jgi:riboflavin kinase/FMN adenylyltransferase